MFKIGTSMIFLATAVAIFFIWSKPAFTEINALQEREADYNETLNNSKKIQDSIKTFMDQYNTIAKNNVDKLNKILPSQSDPIKFILEIEKIVQGNGLILKQIDITKAEELKMERNTGVKKVNATASAKAFEEIPISMTVAGPYKSFSAFLSDLEKSLRLTDIKKLSFSSGSADFYEFNINASIYWGIDEIK